ncbi:NAD(P)-dependent oxidoreductase [Prescottella equi]|uniref:glucose 1-dehydrogenase n=1 Tax=Rhodococcus hoagii TaxID=43767 RepID=UPI000A0FF087|nr:glucose 1-dehydrogenase [Prescottella equi]ORL02244.1 NAD(P)-dependent oxidoreductase [Prescottella equi]
MGDADADTTRTDQLVFQNPVTRYPVIKPPKQHQPEPGLDSELQPRADIGEFSYRGTGRLEGRKALVTGGDSGIGAAVAIAFAREGADVAIAHLPAEEDDAQNVARIVTESGRTAVTVSGDLTDAEFCRRMVDEAAERLGGLDILVNNAGKQIVADTLGELSDEQVEQTYQTNILAMFRTTRAALAHLPAGSSIINTTSVEAYMPAPTLLDYASTKAAINNFTKGLANQLADKGIRVNAVAPGPIWTPLQPSDGQPKEALPEFGHSTPMGRAGQPTELAPAYVYLASPESSYVTGSTLHVNGGMPSP